jgi:hypothetical protein
MRCVGVIGTIGLVAVSLTMNFRFGQSLGGTQWDGLVYGAASACADGFKVILPFAVAYAWRSSHWLATILGAVLWAIFTAYSMTSSLGHSATNRADVAGEKRHDIAIYNDVKHAIGVKQRERDQLQGFRPAAAIQAEIGSKELDRRWQWSKQCSMPASSDARMFCAAVSRLKAELATALRAAELDRELTALGQKLEQSGGRGATGDADAQVALIGDLLGIDEDNVRLALTVMVSLMVELGSGLGLFVIFDERVRRQGDGGSTAVSMQSTASKLRTAEMPVEAEWLNARVVKSSEEAYESESALFRDYCAFLVERNAGPALSLGAFRSFLQQQQIGLIVRKAGRNYICGIRLREKLALLCKAT